MELSLDLTQLWPLIAFAVSFVVTGKAKWWLMFTSILAFAVVVNIPTLAKTFFVGVGLAIFLQGLSEKDGKDKGANSR